MGDCFALHCLNSRVDLFHRVLFVSKIFILVVLCLLIFFFFSFLSEKVINTSHGLGLTG